MKEHKKADNSREDLELVDYRRKKFEDDYRHFSYELEVHFMNSIRNGIPADPSLEEFDLFASEDLLEGVGIMSVVGKEKQMEYMLVSCITLATRASIDGGVPPQNAYEMSDLFLQRCSKAKTMKDYTLILMEVQKSFSTAVLRYRAIRSQDPDVEKTKDYIAGHIFEKISVEEIADTFHVSYTYLSTKFKKIEGIGISEYVRKEKLKIVVNYLRYSDVSISEISERMSFVSASRMSEQFRKEYGMSPIEYRKRYRVDTFMEQ